MPSITKIAVTGGVCGGKTTALASIRSAFARLGYKVITVPEPATEFKSNGILPWDCSSSEEYQRCQMTVQITREHCFEQAARGMADDKILLVCDRGMLDNKYYMTADEFTRVVAELGYSEVELRDSYDAVFHLVTAAKGAEDYYGSATNAVRHETLEEAAAMDDGFIEAWSGHPHLRVIDNSTDFEGKMRRLIHEISYFLGEVAPYALERKFLVDYPTEDVIDSLPACARTEIVTTYLRSAEGMEIRIRCSHDKGSSYSYTEKRIDGTRKHLVRRAHLSAAEYETLMLQADPNKRPLRKTRYSFAHEGQYFELDVFPNWGDRAILKIELSDEEQPIYFPPQLHVLYEVTGNPTYRNANIASL